MEGNDTYIPPGSATESSDILWLSKVAIYPNLARQLFSYHTLSMGKSKKKCIDAFQSLSETT